MDIEAVVKKIDEVIARTWAMAQASSKREVHPATLDWAQKELRQLFAKTPDNPDGYEAKPTNICSHCDGFGYLPDDDTGEVNPPVGGVLCYVCQGSGKPKPDDRLLTDDEIGDMMARNCVHSFTIQGRIVAKAQRDLTASIIRQECAKEKAEFGLSVHEAAICQAESECQQKLRGVRNEGYKAGIKEVMEWFNNHRGMPTQKRHPDSRRYYHFEERDWQAKLKEWEAILKEERIE